VQNLSWNGVDWLKFADWAMLESEEAVWMDTSVLLTFVGVVALISLVPGPDMLYIIANGVSSGPRAGAVAAVGMSSGLAIHTLAAALGLSALLTVAPLAMEVIRACGIVFLLYLAVDAFRTSLSTPDEAVTVPRRSLRRVYGMAIATNLGNPKIVVFYLAFLPQFTSQHAAWPIPVQLLALGALFIAVGIIVDGAVGLASGRLSDFLTRRRDVRRWLHRLSATIFAGLAVRLAVDGFKQA
jgi:threonine/homoserine/homoserine lactone efflux protein